MKEMGHAHNFAIEFAFGLSLYEPKWYLHVVFTNFSS